MMEPGISPDTTADPCPAQDRPSSASNANTDGTKPPQAGMTASDHPDLSDRNTMETAVPRSQQDTDVSKISNLVTKDQSEHESNEAESLAAANVPHASKEQTVHDSMPILSLQAENTDTTTLPPPSTIATFDINPAASANNDPNTRQTADDHPDAVEQLTAQFEPQVESTSRSGSRQTSNDGKQLLTSINGSADMTASQQDTAAWASKDAAEASEESHGSEQPSSRPVIDFGAGLLQGIMATASLELRNESTVGADVSCWLDSLGASEEPTPLLPRPGRQLQRHVSVLQVSAYVSEECSPDA